MRKDKRDDVGEAPIYLRITVNGKRAEMSTNRKVDVSKWDSDTQRVKGRSESARILNDYLDGLQNRINRDFNSFNEKGEEITTYGLKDSVMVKHRRLTFAK